MQWSIQIRDDGVVKDIPSDCLVAGAARIKLIIALEMFINTLEIVSAFSDHFDFSISI